MIKPAAASTRLIAVMAFIAAPLLLAALSIGNALSGLEDRGRSLVQAETLQRLQRHRGPETQDAAYADMDQVYIAGETVSLAGAVLRQKLVDAISARGGSLIETRVGDQDPDPTDTAAQTVMVSASLTITNDGLGGLLLDLEAGLPYLTISALTVSRSTDEAPSNDPELRVDLTVNGLRTR